MGWKLQKVTKIGKLLELLITREDKVENNYHPIDSYESTSSEDFHSSQFHLRTNHDHLINVVGILVPKEELINQITLIAEKR